MKRLAVFLDGTWNAPTDNTNVWRLRSMLAHSDETGVEQLAYYDQGVGTKWYNRIRGGAAGRGLSENVRQAYRWLMENYDEGAADGDGGGQNVPDEIFVFGFSRGAFTARSLAGMISKCGLMKPGSPMPVSQVFDRYTRDAKPIYRLPKSVDSDRTDLSQEDRWMIAYSRRVRIKFIGVWDTVGALGVKVRRSGREARGEHDKHFVRLSSSFDHAYHALAIDEHRKPYRQSMWYRFIPEKKPDLAHVPPPEVEQRWFIGAHSNVGGGYRNDELSQIPLEWIQGKASSAGLHFRYDVPLSGSEYLSPVRDSYREFLKGAYLIIKLGRRARRVIGEGRRAVTGGWIEPHLETVDASVFRRWQDDQDYRPQNLAEWASHAGVDLNAVGRTQRISEV